MTVAAHDAEGRDLRLEQLTKTFSSFVAVDGIDLTVPAGSFFALLGPSGCGKTTTLRMVAGLEEPTAGRVLIGDEDVTRARPYRRPVNTVFQSYALFPHLDVSENVAFGLRRRGARDVRRQVDEVLELVELGGLARRKPGQLSGGQQQRVALARAIVNRPAVLLLDEPLGALDLKLRRQMQIELKRIQTEVGLTFVHVTHDQEEAMTMADTIAVMNAGRIEQLGSPVDLYSAPRTAYVANFLGQSNLVRARRAGVDGDDVLVDAHGSRLRVPARAAGSLDALLVGVRPEKVSLVRKADEAVARHRNSLAGVVTDVSFTGVSTQYLVRTGAGQELTVFVQNASGASLVPVGSDVRLEWDVADTFALPGDEDLTAGVDEDELTLRRTAVPAQQAQQAQQAR